MVPATAELPIAPVISSSLIYSIVDPLGKHFHCVCVLGNALDPGNQAVAGIHTIHWYHGSNILVGDTHSEFRFLKMFFLGGSRVMGVG